MQRYRSGTVHWTIYLSVSIDSEFSVLVATQAISRDAELSPIDFELMPRHLPGLTTDYVTKPAMLSVCDKPSPVTKP